MNIIYSEQDNITLTWNPEDIITPDILAPTSYYVSVEIYWYDTQNNSWNLFQEVAHKLNNSGEAEISGIQPGPHLNSMNFPQGVTQKSSQPGTEFSIVPTAFHVVPKLEDASTVPHYLERLFQQENFGIWSSVAYKLNYDYYLSDLCQDWIDTQLQTGDDIQERVPSCPCTTTQARRANSGYTELRSPGSTLRQEFFNPSADACYLSMVFG